MCLYFGPSCCFLLLQEYTKEADKFRAGLQEKIPDPPQTGESPTKPIDEKIEEATEKFKVRDE